MGRNGAHTGAGGQAAWPCPSRPCPSVMPCIAVPCIALPCQRRAGWAGSAGPQHLLFARSAPAQCGRRSAPHGAQMAGAGPARNPAAPRRSQRRWRRSHAACRAEPLRILHARGALRADGPSLRTKGMAACRPASRKAASAARRLHCRICLGRGCRRAGSFLPCALAPPAGARQRQGRAAQSRWRGRLQRAGWKQGGGGAAARG